MKEEEKSSSMEKTKMGKGRCWKAYEMLYTRYWSNPEIGCHHHDKGTEQFSATHLKIITNFMSPCSCFALKREEGSSDGARNMWDTR